MALVRRSGCGKFPAGTRVGDMHGEHALVLEDALYEEDDQTGRVFVSAWVLLESDSAVRFAERIVEESLTVL